MGVHIQAKKSLGQHFLNNTRVPRKMVEAGDVGQGDVVLEIGPGTGVLTEAILSAQASVIAIEADPRAIETLKARFPTELREGKLLIIHEDVRALNLEALEIPRNYKVISNIPYYLSGMLFRLFLETRKQPSCLVFLVQKEVAERIVRDPKESILSLSVKVFGSPRYIETVKRGNFTPPPRVDSAIIAVDEISKKRLGSVTGEWFFQCIHQGFRSKRKQLLGNLTSLADRPVLMNIFSTLGLPLDVRGEDVSLSLWLKLAAYLYRHRHPQKKHTVNHR